MPDLPRLGSKVRALRRRETISQAKLAERLGISASYLNLIENDRRPLTAALLIRLAQVFSIDLKQFAADEEAQLVSDLMEVFGDPLFEHHELAGQDVRELASQSPGIARAVVSLFHAFGETRSSLDTLAQRLTDGQELTGIEKSRLPSEEVSDFIQRRNNFFPELENGAEHLIRSARLEGKDMFTGLADFLAEAHQVKVQIEKVGAMGRKVRNFDPERRTLQLSEVLRRGSRNFQLAHQVGQLAMDEALARLTQDPLLTTPESQGLARVALANYFAAAVLMPYEKFLRAAQEERYDVELLGDRFRTGVEQVCHRFTSLRRPGAEGVPFFLIRVDIAGNISKRFGAEGVRFPRFSGLCPRWVVHGAFLTPDMIKVQLMKLPDDQVYFCIARTLRKHGGGYHVPATIQSLAIGCPVRRARELVYAEGVDLDRLESAMPVGVTCRLCPRTDCEQRAFPALTHRLKVDQNVRGASFYAPTGD